MSESQERMCAIVKPSNVTRFMEICEKWEVTATVIGEVTSGDRLVITWHGEIIVEVPPRTVAHEGPVYNRPMEKPDYVDRAAAEVLNFSLPQTSDQIRQAVLDLISSPNMADKSWVTSQFDKYVQGNTIQSQPEDSGMIRIDESTNLGIAISTDANANWSYLNPYQGAKLALAEAARNIATAGARPLAVTNCLNFGSPEDSGVMWQFAETVRGLADGCLEMGLPVTGGNVSFYNQTGEVAILPTPIIGVLGVIQDVRTRTPMAHTVAGLDLYLLGKTENDFAGSQWAYMQGMRGGITPTADLQREGRLIDLLLEGQSIFAAAHDLSQGGLAVTICEMVLRNKVGATITLAGDVGLGLLSETPGRVVVAIDPGHTSKLSELVAKYDITLTRLGATGGATLKINETEIDLKELNLAYTATFPKLFG